jgi:hypothetical protein
MAGGFKSWRVVAPMTSTITSYGAMVQWGIGDRRPKMDLCRVEALSGKVCGSLPWSWPSGTMEVTASEART